MKQPPFPRARCGGRREDPLGGETAAVPALPPPRGDHFPWLLVLGHRSSPQSWKVREETRHPHQFWTLREQPREAAHLPTQPSACLLLTRGLRWGGSGRPGPLPSCRLPAVGQPRQSHAPTCSLSRNKSPMRALQGGAIFPTGRSAAGDLVAGRAF